jgi:endonuclease YncB( thermonuclease family)
MLRAPVLAALAMILGGFFAGSEAAVGSGPFAQRVTVTVLVDPVTVEVGFPDGTTERVQLYGVAAPDPESCALTEATADAAALALGKSVWLVAPQGRPPKKSRRPLLAYVLLPKGPDLGLLLVKRGEATVRTGQHPWKQRASYVRAEKAAQAASLGLWGCTAGSAAGTPTTTTTATPAQDQGQGQGQGKGHGQAHGSSDQPGSGHGSGNGKQ